VVMVLIAVTYRISVVGHPVLAIALFALAAGVYPFFEAILTQHFSKTKPQGR